MPTDSRQVCFKLVNCALEEDCLRLATVAPHVAGDPTDRAANLEVHLAPDGCLCPSCEELNHSDAPAAHALAPPLAARDRPLNKRVLQARRAATLLTAAHTLLLFKFFLLEPFWLQNGYLLFGGGAPNRITPR